MGWTCNGVPQDGQVYNSGFPHDPVENPDSSNICFKCELPRSAVQSSHSQPGRTGSGTTSNRSLVPWVLGLVFLILASGGIYGINTYLKSRSTSSPTPETTSSPIVGSSPTSPINEVTPPPETHVLSEDLQAKISSGDRPLFKDASYAQRDDGIIAFSKGDYNLALQRFEEAVLSTPNQPEPEIYLNNTKARITGNPYVIAAVVPITKSTDQAKEMLRGIADSQRFFNDRGGANNRLLEVIIADDENDPTIARQVAQTLVDSYKNELLAIIGHNSSDVSASALEIYEKAKIAMISPTSTSTKLSGKTFFRTVASDAKSGEVLADYINSSLKVNSVGLFYVSSSSYSTSLYEAFDQNFRGQVLSYDFSDPNLDPEKVLNDLGRNDIDTVLLFPNVSQRDRALGVAKLAKQRNQRLKLFGGDALYTSQTLLEGQSAVEGMILVVPWFAEGEYAEIAEKRWQGQVSWRTASAYDATQSVITALQRPSQQLQTPEELVQKLYQPDFNVPKEFTSGQSIFFDNNGNRKIRPILVEVKMGSPSPMGTTLGFQPIQ